MKKFSLTFLLLLISTSYSWGAQVGNYPLKTIPVVADKVVTVDSEDGNKLKNVPIQNLPISNDTQTVLNNKANISDMTVLSADMKAFIETADDTAALAELGAQPLNAHLTDLSDGSLTASKVGNGYYVADDCSTVSSPATGAICDEY